MSRIFLRRLSSAAQAQRAAARSAPDARWLAQSSSRVGACLTFGCNPEQTSEAGSILNELGRDWRDLVAGSEGFLTAKERRGLWKHGVVWGEQDVMVCHVNNVTYVRYAESARINWMANYANCIDPANKEKWDELCSSRGTGLIIRSIKVDFKFPMQYPDKVTVMHKLRSLPEPEHDSMFLDVIMFSEKHRRPVARAVEDIVLYDYRKGKKKTFDSAPYVLDAFRNTFELQQQAMAANSERVANIDARITALEKSTWDREGAVEDFGSAGNQK